MRALVSRGPGRFLLEERPDPQPGPGELQLRPLYTGVCVSDQHVYLGHEFGPPWREGLVLGHETVATVSALGEGVVGFAMGDRVTVDPRVFCHQCPKCRAGLPTLCERGAQWMGVAEGRDGAFAELCLAPDYACYPLPRGSDERVAAMTEPLACVTRCLRRSGLALDDNVAVLGLEDYGLLALQRLRQAGAAAVAALDPSRLRRDAAAALGATLVLDPSEPSAAKALRELMPAGADLVLVCMEDYVAASAEYLRLGFRICRAQGTLCVLRTYGSAPYARIDPQVPYMKEITVRHAGSFFGEEPLRGGRSRGDWQVALDAIARGEIAELTGSRVVDFAELADPALVQDVFSGYPDRATKTIVRIAGEPEQSG
jgi:threonine dehydrogenase-like Zn-dependent dehydrogenase